MGAETVTADVIISLREYARSASVDITLRIGGVVLMTAGLELVRALASLTMKGARRVPAAVQILVVALVTAAVVHPRSRAWLVDALARVPANIGRLIRAIAPLVFQASVHANANHLASEAAWRTASTDLQLANGVKQPLRTHVLAACVAATTPLTVAEIEQRVRAQGYVSDSPTSRAYLRRVLGDHAAIIETPYGRWTVVGRS